jgi:hypothetical protein
MTSPDGKLAVWFVEPLGIVDVHEGGHFSDEQARFLAVDAGGILSDLARRSGTKASFIHDWSRVSTYDMATRRRIIEWGLSWGPRRVEKIWVVLGPATPTIVRMACSLGAMAMNVARIPIEVSDDDASARSHPRVRRGEL